MRQTQPKPLLLLVILFFISSHVFAHNGKVAYAYPLNKITVDGNLSDWPQQIAKYSVATILSDTRPQRSTDFSGFFQVGYRMDNHSLYIALTVTDDDFIEDTTENVRYNSQDCFELCIDARHIAGRSGVASFMYSKKLRNINKAAFDPFAGKASWDIMEVVMVHRGNQRIYEWRISLGNELVVGKSIGFDFAVFDKDTDNSFTISSWGKGGDKYRLASSLGDILVMPAGQSFATIRGSVRSHNKAAKGQLPEEVRIRSLKNPALWLESELDSTGNFMARLPAGSYEVSLPDEYIASGNDIYIITRPGPVTINIKSGGNITLPAMMVSSALAPDLLPAKGILHDFDPATSPAVIDNFINTYRKYYNIPGVSLALIKDGKLVYHQTYGESNVATGKKVTDSTLFEAASVTKPVFAFAVQRLAERGIIDLDKPLYLYLPYKDIDYDDRYKLITARHVLTHRTGFPNWREGKLEIKFTPGTGFGYSGEGFEYLKMVIEKITGKKVEHVLKEEVIEPMGLYHTYFSNNDTLQRVVASGHFDGIPSTDPPPSSPGMAYSMHTEAKIFTRFMLYLLEQKGLSAQTYETMFSKHSEYNLDPGDEKPPYPVYMGMSLEIKETPYGKSFNHGGNNGDFKCFFEVYKDLKMGFALFTNSSTSDQLLRNIDKFLVEGK